MFGIVRRHHKIQVHFRNNKYSGQLMPKMHQFQAKTFLPFFKTVVEVNFVVVAYFRDWLAYVFFIFIDKNRQKPLLQWTNKKKIELVMRKRMKRVLKMLFEFGHKPKS